MAPMQVVCSQLTAVSSQVLRQVWESRGLRLRDDEQEPHLRAVADILRANLASGRLWRAIGKEGGTGDITDACLRRYGLRVARHYWVEHERVAGLACGNEGLWEELRRQLVRRACRTLWLHAGLSPAEAREQASDYAQEACKRILCGRYPYDVPFMAWATRILVNCILEDRSRSGDVLARCSLTELDPENAPFSDRTDHKGLDSLPNHCGTVENRLLLLDTIAQLPSEAQRLVILLEFFQGWGSSEIAEALDRTKQAVYNLKHRALRNLRRLLDQQGTPRTGGRS